MNDYRTLAPVDLNMKKNVAAESVRSVSDRRHRLSSAVPRCDAAACADHKTPEPRFT